MGNPPFKAPDGGYYETARVTEDTTQSGLQQGSETSVLVEQKIRPEAFPSGLPMSVWVNIYAISGLIFEVFLIPFSAGPFPFVFRFGLISEA
jgi:hypothetical protein